MSHPVKKGILGIRGRLRVYDAQALVHKNRILLVMGNIGARPHGVVFMRPLSLMRCKKTRLSFVAPPPAEPLKDEPESGPWAQPDIKSAQPARKRRKKNRFIRTHPYRGSVFPAPFNEVIYQMYTVSIRIFLALLTAFLLGLSFPFPGHGWLIWIALVPLLLALRHISPRLGFLLSFIAGTGYYMILHGWGFIFGAHVWLALALWQGFYIGLTGAVISMVLSDGKPSSRMSRIFLPALLWTSYEYIKSLGPLGVNWGSLAYSQYTWLPIIQVAGLTGMYGLSFLIVMVNISTTELIVYGIDRMKKETGPPGPPLLAFWGVTALFFTGALLYGMVTLGHYERLRATAPALRVGLVQPNIDILMKWDKKNLEITLRRLEDLTRDAKQAPLIIWPETSVPTLIPLNAKVKERICRFVSDQNVYLLTGAPMNEQPDRVLNTVFLFSPGSGITSHYSKIHLVPFGEYLPLNKYLRKYTIFDRVQNLSPGKTLTSFTTPWARFSTLICFESDFPWFGRVNTLQGAQFLVVVTNDAWFEQTAVATHHISWDVFRAAENRIPLIQSGNTGVCAFIDGTGRIRSKTEIYTQRTLVDEIRLVPPGTLYSRCGDVFTLSALIATMALLYRERIILSREKKKGKKEKSEKQRSHI